MKRIDIDWEIDTKHTDADYTTVEFHKIVNETEKALEVDFGDVTHWIPKSQCLYGRSRSDSTKLVIALTNWIYEQKFPDE